LIVIEAIKVLKNDIKSYRYMWFLFLYPICFSLDVMMQLIVLLYVCGLRKHY
jgi:hypothetical protein